MKIDTYKFPEHPIRIIAIPDRDFDQDSFQNAVTQSLDTIASCKVTRLRQRDFLLWLGNISSKTYGEFYYLGLPYRIDYRIVEMLRKELSRFSDRIEISVVAPKDFNGRPYARYLFGKKIYYKVVESKEFTVSSKRNIQTRACRLTPRVAKQNTYYTPQTIKYFARREHDFKSWQDTRTEILKFIYSLHGACSYKTLKQIVTKNFGIAVYNEPSTEFTQYGIIRMGGENPYGRRPVRILIATNLPESIKYVVLAHELSHFALHFPLIWIGQVIEEQSWAIPELETLYRARLHNNSQSIPGLLEDEANELAVQFVIPPPFFPVRRLAEVVFERDRPLTARELIWKFLQSQFPESPHAEASWGSLDASRKEAHTDTTEIPKGGSSGGKSLFECMLNAAIRIEERQKISRLAQKEMKKMFNEIQSVLNETGEFDAQRKAIKALLNTGISEGTAHPAYSSWDGNDVFCREILAPISGGSASARIPLRPSRTNISGRFSGKWDYLLDKDSPHRTIAQWKKHCKEECEFVLYKLESWEKHNWRGNGKFQNH